MNRSHLTVALVPLALLGITCGFSAAHRAVAAITPRSLGTPGSGRALSSTTEVTQYADTICSRLTGTSAVARDVSWQSAYSWRRHTLVREWNVLCDTPQGEYLLRINADTKRVYAVNRMDTPSVPVVAADDSGPVTRGLAEQRARQYLQLVGVPLNGLKPLPGDAAAPPDAATGTAPQWNFTYQRRVPGLGERLLKVSVNGTTGNLEHVWNPVNAM